MTLQPRPPLTLPLTISPLVVAGGFILLCGLLKEPGRRQFSALMIAGAGAAYLGGGLGGWELGFCALLTLIAYRGLSDYRYIGAGWVLHTCWDVIHHLYGNPILPFLPTSSAGCAICDLGLAAWYFAGAPSPYSWVTAADRTAKSVGG
ncbi:MAG TPA: DUF6010 family protein [Caulobacteraceae bacterium]|nr:DUF6010 family protein [Caulobacteraceae bacterium]